jgi:hypothetical protein
LATGGNDHTVRVWELVVDRPVARLPVYRSDAASTTDELARAEDAEALAELITARPPLAVGLSGTGARESHFLALLQEQVHNVTKGDNPLAHKAVRQVRFNAWQYAETDLWASLVAELFAQLAAQPGSGRGAEQCGRSRLTAELVAKRGLRERLTAARAPRDDLDQALRRARRDDTHAWQELTTTQRERLRTLVGADSERYFRDAMRTAAVFQETGRTWWTLLRGGRLALIAVPSVAAGVTTTRRPAATDSTGELTATRRLEGLATA